MVFMMEDPMDFKPYKIKWGFWKEVLRSPRILAGKFLLLHGGS
jgi:hypothetical protein